MNLSRAAFLGYFLLLPHPMRMWVIQITIVGFAFCWSLEPVEAQPGGLFSGGTPGYALGTVSWMWALLFVIAVCRLPAAGRRARAQMLSSPYAPQRVQHTPAPTPALAPVQHAPTPRPGPARTPAPTPAPAVGPRLIVVTHQRQVRRAGHTRSGIPVRDRRTVNPDTHLK